MGLNKKILEEISEKTKDDEEMKNFLISILQIENKGIGHYKQEYNLQLEKYCKEVERKCV